MPRVWCGDHRHAQLVYCAVGSNSMEFKKNKTKSFFFFFWEENQKFFGQQLRKSSVKIKYCNEQSVQRSLFLFLFWETVQRSQIRKFENETFDMENYFTIKLVMYAIDGFKSPINVWKIFLIKYCHWLLLFLYLNFHFSKETDIVING